MRKIKELILLSVILLPKFDCSNVNYDNHRPVFIKKAVTVSQNQIEDNGVYFIDFYENKSLRMNVSNSNYQNGNGIIVYHKTGWGNERFVLKKQFNYKSKLVYSIVPLNSQDKVLRIEDDSSESGKKLEIGDEQYSDSKLLSDKFFFEYNETTGRYKIESAISDFFQCLKPQNNTHSSGVSVVQDSFNPEYATSYEWLLTRTDTLGINSKTRTEINGTSKTYYNFTVQRSGEYIFKNSYYSKELFTKIYLYTSSGDSLKTVNNGCFGLSYYFSAKGDYKVAISGTNSSQKGFVYTQVMPQKPLYFNTFWDPSLQYDNVTGLLGKTAGFSAKGYYLNVLANMGKKSLFEKDLNGIIHMNNDYYVFWGHGTPGGVQFYDGLYPESNLLYANQLPDNLTNIKCSIWLTCSGAKLASFGDYNTSMARETVIKGARSSIGWRGPIAFGGVWLMNFLDDMFDSDSIPEASKNASDQTASDIWWHYVFSKKENNDLWNPIIYYRNSNNEIKYVVGNGKSYKDEENDDGGFFTEAKETRKNDYKDNSKSFKINNYDLSTIDIKHDGRLFNVYKIGNTITNISPNSIDAQYKIQKALTIHKTYSFGRTDSENYIFSGPNGVCPYSIDYSNDEATIDNVSTNKKVSLEDFINIANYNF